jgi:hypothetical protein
MPPRGVPCWSKEATNEIQKQFDLFTESNGKDGWDPQNRDASYIKPCIQQNEVLRPFLANNLGGHDSHKTSSKILQGYERVSSEYFVKLAKSGIRRSTFLCSLILPHF